MGYTDEELMREALKEAKKAADIGETPVGAVITWDGEILCRAHNLRETSRIATAHAELLAIEEACRTLNGWRLHRAALYVTLEPCPMCAGAIINARVPKIVFGAYDKKAGCCKSVLPLFDAPFNHRPEMIGGVLEEECQAILTGFFSDLREKLRTGLRPEKKKSDFMADKLQSDLDVIGDKDS